MKKLAQFALVGTIISFFRSNN